MQEIELLAPAKDAEVGMEAFRHGADAVYIGSPRYGARAAAGNSVADIARLASFGHQYGARTIVAFNTILRDDELEEAQRLAREEAEEDRRRKAEEEREMREAEHARREAEREEMRASLDDLRKSIEQNRLEARRFQEMERDAGGGGENQD